MSKTSFALPQKIETAYQRAISRTIESILTPHRSMNYEEWVEHLYSVSQSPEMVGQSEYLARQMTQWVNASNARSWRVAASQSQRGATLYRLLQRELGGCVGSKLRDIVQSNARLISSIPSDVAGQLTGEIAKAQQAGARPETIARIMRVRFPKLTRSRIQLIARTETSKASAALNEARCDELNIPAYEWLTSEDQRVRPSHRNMDSVIVLWSDPPSPEALVHERSTLGHYHCGNCPNCRCTSAPLLSLDDVKWPHRVYSSERITRMTRKQFAQLIGVREEIAA